MSAIFLAGAVVCLMFMVFRPRESWIAAAILFVVFGLGFVVTMFIENIHSEVKHTCPCSECDCVAAPVGPNDIEKGE